MFIDEDTLEAIAGLIYIETSYQEVCKRLLKIEQYLKSEESSFDDLVM